MHFDYLIADGDLSEYRKTWDYQKRLHEQVAAGEVGDTVIFVEHEPVYTAGRRTEPHQRPFDGTPVVDVDRGGLITYHGPGQLVGYPIIGLPDGVGVVDYVRRLEEAIIRTLASYDLATRRVEGRTGVWLAADATRPERKICAIGVRVSKRTTLHGFALNVTAQSQGPFANIIPCGITDAGVTTMEHEGVFTTLNEIAHRLEAHLVELLRFEAYEQSR